MASCTKVINALLLATCIFLLLNPTFHARKLLGDQVQEDSSPILQQNLVLNTLSKGHWKPPSSQSKGGNGSGLNSSSTGRMLGSVPSPGVGH
ncbi:hypothetical protein FCM35_KLT08447 [Carex littledalei]|uniref:Uncharacterized protein n=1 Tax=Carex littledalei TaxID=544730 RepID=A0A833V6W8_9POAL|nr:hypothetical protein FCM35_KLT08447 [Carex littledalei]